MSGIEHQAAFTFDHYRGSWHLLVCGPVQLSLVFSEYAQHLELHLHDWVHYPQQSQLYVARLCMYPLC
jgi:hypothetical protein